MDHQSNVTGVDTHAHIFRPDLPLAAGRRYAPTYEAALSDWLSHQDAHGLSHGVLIQPSFLGTDNSFIAAALQSYPNRLRAVAVVDMDLPEAELDRLDALGFVGARLNLVGREISDFTAPDWQSFFNRLAERAWQVEIQRNFDDLAAFIPAIAASGVSVMIDHFGLPQGGVNPENPKHAEFLDVLHGTPNIWMKLSAPYRSAMTPTAAAQTVSLLRSAMGGVDRFVWGSDWPHTQHEAETGYADQVARFDALPFTEAERAQILIANPANLFRLT